MNFDIYECIFNIMITQGKDKIQSCFEISTQRTSKITKLLNTVTLQIGKTYGHLKTPAILMDKT